MIKACREILNVLLTTSNMDQGKLEDIKRAFSEKYRLKKVPSNSQILSYAAEGERATLRSILLKKPSRSISGVSVIAVMSSPADCPHGRCIYCPGGPNSDSPQSYTGREPAALRAYQNSFDPYMQVQSRLNQLKAIGHPVNKVELIVMGGTFPARDLSYQQFFIKNCLEALSGVRSRDLSEAKVNAEKASIRNVGMTFETRPDYCKIEHVDRMLDLGATRVELGVQALSDEVYRDVKRGHTVEDVIQATRIVKDSGLKLCYHMMPGLPGMDLKSDLRMFYEVFESEDFKPDMLKIYPCLVLEKTELYTLWENHRYQPYNTEELIEFLLKVMEKIPPWIRIQRIQRDIPAGLIVAGNKKSDLRELVLDAMDERNIKTNEIRFREVGHQYYRYGKTPRPGDVAMKIHSYNASKGQEIFISFEDLVQDILIGYLRLRIPSDQAHRLEVTVSKTAVIRELHIFGPELEVGGSPSYQWQHRGYGKALVEEAERIAEAVYGCDIILVTSGLGAREYYRRLGYSVLGPYMCKKLS